MVLLFSALLDVQVYPVKKRLVLAYIIITKPRGLAIFSIFTIYHMGILVLTLIVPTVTATQSGTM